MPSAIVVQALGGQGQLARCDHAGRPNSGCGTIATKTRSSFSRSAILQSFGTWSTTPYLGASKGTVAASVGLRVPGRLRLSRRAEKSRPKGASFIDVPAQMSRMKSDAYDRTCLPLSTWKVRSRSRSWPLNRLSGRCTILRPKRGPAAARREGGIPG